MVPVHVVTVVRGRRVCVIWGLGGGGYTERCIRAVTRFMIVSLTGNIANKEASCGFLYDLPRTHVHVTQLAHPP